MDNTDLIYVFYENIDSNKLMCLADGPPKLGGRNQHLATSFKVFEDKDYSWRPTAVKRLAEMIQSFLPDYRMYRLDNPFRGYYWNVIEDPFVCIREYYMRMPEVWTEPSENLSPEELDEFTPRKKWDEHTRVVFEVVFEFGL